MTNNTTTLFRDDYGCLTATGKTTDDDRSMYLAAFALVQQAAKAGKIPGAFDEISWDRKGRASGSALHYELYDISASGSTVLVCLRSTEGSKYGVRTTDKTYVLIGKAGRGVKVADANKAVAAKSAKAAGNLLGVAVAVCQGKRPAPAPKCLAPRTGYKIVRRDDDSFVSVWDNSEWAIGKSRIEKATPDHEGGFYFYASLEDAIDQAVARKTFGDAREYHDLSILEVEVAGREFCVGVGVGTVAQILGLEAVKRCATRLKPIREVCAVL